MPAPKGNQNAKGHVGTGGRPAIYNNRIPGIIKSLRERGATEHEIAEALDISPRTLRDWKASHIEVCAALDVGNEAMIRVARRGLFERAAGYTYEAEKVFQFQGQIIRAKTTEHVPPDPTAALRILERLDPEQWKERTEVEGKGTFSLADLVALSMEHRARKAEQAKLIEARKVIRQAFFSPIESKGIPESAGF
jgi:transposase-like protein